MPSTKPGQYCLFRRRDNGYWVCARRRCRYLFPRQCERPPWRICNGTGPGSLLAQLLALFGITKNSYIEFKRELGLSPACDCDKHARDVDEFYYFVLPKFDRWLAAYWRKLPLLSRMLYRDCGPIASWAHNWHGHLINGWYLYRRWGLEALSWLLLVGYLSAVAGLPLLIWRYH